MNVITQNLRRSGCYLGESAALNIVNEEIIVVSGSGKLAPGTVLGKITASGKFAPHDAAAVDGSETAAAILFHPVDATAADAKSVATTNGPASILDSEACGLIWKDGIADADKAAGEAALRAKLLKILPQHAG